MSVLNVTVETFEAEVLKNPKPVLVDFWAPWCGPCKMVKPIVEEIAGERSDIKVGLVNVDEQMELAKQFRVMSIPTLMIFKDGQLARKTMGAMSKEELLEFIDQN